MDYKLKEDTSGIKLKTFEDREVFLLLSPTSDIFGKVGRLRSSQIYAERPMSNLLRQIIKARQLMYNKYKVWGNFKLYNKKL